MPTNESIHEVVRFTQSGLDEIDTRTRAYAEQLKTADERARLLADSLGDPVYARHASRMSEAARATERATQALRNQQRAADLASGAFAQHARQMAAITRESERLARAERLASLVSAHGRFGGVIRNNAAELSMLGRTLGLTTAAGVALGVGLARSGLQGTVEGYRLEYAWLRLSRSVAAIAVPAIDKLASVLHRVAGWFEKLSGPQQDAIMKMGLLTVGAMALGSALSGVVTVGSAAVRIFQALAASKAAAGVGNLASAGAAAASAGSGLGAGLAGGAAGGAAGVGVQRIFVGGAASAMGAAAIGAATPRALGAGSRIVPAIASSAPLMLGAAGGMTGPRVTQLGPGTPNPGMAAAGASRLGMLAAGGAAAGGVIASGISQVSEFRKDSSIGETGRGIGRNIARSGDMIFGGEFLRMMGFKSGGPLGQAFDAIFGGAGEKSGAGPRRDISPLQVAQDDLGGAHARIQEELLKVDAAMAEEKEKERQAIKETTDALNNFAARLEQHANALPGQGSGGVMDAYGEALKRYAQGVRPGQ